ncbi:hypothetical protein [Candidatus Parabeggiatoa sp. HSG14]|uniref:hypothetical protein n=1 Tax=Candidatus Parabeggiatoa sp. HSG14 TaxID=3055593 RepID=UPI0025A7115C|nr:hypothetical protein [Thiotrichales bacterium HSG14]
MFIRLTLLLTILCSFSQPLYAKESTLTKKLLRLFTTVQERTAINKEREKKPPLTVFPPTGTGDEDFPPPPPMIGSLTFNGLVKRSQGTNTVWINGSENIFQPTFTVDVNKIADDLSVPIFLTNSAQEIILRPGQSVNTIDGSIEENFKQSSIRKTP